MKIGGKSKNHIRIKQFTFLFILTRRLLLHSFERIEKLIAYWYCTKIFYNVLDLFVSFVSVRERVETRASAFDIFDERWKRERDRRKIYSHYIRAPWAKISELSFFFSNGLEGSRRRQSYVARRSRILDCVRP